VSGVLPVAQADRELFIFLMGFDAVPNEGGFDRIRAGEFDGWKKMQAIAAHREAHTAGLIEAASLVFRIEAAGALEYEAENFERWKETAREIAPALRAALSEHAK
jgi:hypothetical protein